MAQRSGTTGTELVGREPELETLREFLGSVSAPRMLVLHGPPGMGKTTLWEAGCAFAAESGYRVLRARASDTEVELAYSSVADLLETVTSAELQPLPSPQQQALQVALLRIDPTDEARTHAPSAPVWLRFSGTSHKGEQACARLGRRHPVARSRPPQPR